MQYNNCGTAGLRPSLPSDIHCPSKSTLCNSASATVQASSDRQWHPGLFCTVDYRPSLRPPSMLQHCVCCMPFISKLYRPTVLRPPSRALCAQLHTALQHIGFQFLPTVRQRLQTIPEMLVSVTVTGRQRREDLWMYFTFDVKDNKTLCKPCGATLAGKKYNKLKASFADNSSCCCYSH